MRVPMITIVIPVYNIEEYIEKCVKSILKQQTNLLYEVLLIDDGSTDGSGEKCDVLSSIHTRVSVIHKKNDGVSSARNLGVDYAKGKWIWFVDGDDYLLPGALASLEASLFNCDSDMIAISYEQETATGEMIQYIPQTIRSSHSRDGINYLLTPDIAAAVWAYIFNIDILRKNDMRMSQELKYGEDRIYIIEYLYYVKTISILRSPLYRYVYRTNSAVNKKGFSRIISDQLNSILILKHRLIEKRLPLKYVDYQIGYIIWLYLALQQDNRKEFRLAYSKFSEKCRKSGYINMVLLFVEYNYDFCYRQRGNVLKKVLTIYNKLKRKLYL